MNDKQVITMILKNGTSAGIVQCSMKPVDLICYKVPRKRLKEASTIEELNNNGVYILIGEDTASNRKIVEVDTYIGKSTDLLHRMIDHNKRKDFWNEVLFFTTKTNSLNEAHSSYIEYALCEEAKRINKDTSRYTILNKQDPKNVKAEDDIVTDAEKYIEIIKVYLDVFGCNLFRENINVDEKNKNENEILYISFGGDKEFARGIITDEGFTVLKGSKVREDTSNVPKERMKKFEAGRASEDIVNGEYIRDHVYTTPSEASVIILANSNNGREMWKNKEGKSINQIEANQR